MLIFTETKMAESVTPRTSVRAEEQEETPQGSPTENEEEGNGLGILQVCKIQHNYL